MDQGGITLMMHTRNKLSIINSCLIIYPSLSSARESQTSLVKGCLYGTHFLPTCWTRWNVAGEIIVGTKTNKNIVGWSRLGSNTSLPLIRTKCTTEKVRRQRQVVKKYNSPVRSAADVFASKSVGVQNPTI